MRKTAEHTENTEKIFLFFSVSSVSSVVFFFALCALSACVAPPGFQWIDALKNLQSTAAAERENAFQAFTRADAGTVARLKNALETGSRQGFPIVALLYVHGEGDAVPFDLRARHLAAFQWPASFAADNAIVEPYVWNEIERDLIRSGRPALRLLADALAKEAPSETKALQVVRVMLRIGGRAAAAEFARLLDSDRTLDGVRVCDVAAGALLYIGRQEPALRAADRDALVKAARDWWAKGRDQTEDEWIRDSVAALGRAWTPEDREGIRSALELLVGQTIPDPKDWTEKNPAWMPAHESLHPEALLPLLSADRPAAFEANRQLERITGTCVHLPRMERLSDLCAALRLWQPPPDLRLRWRRVLESPLLRMSLVVIGWHPKREANHVLVAMDKYFHATEDEALSGPDGNYTLFVQSRDSGTRVIFNEYMAGDRAPSGTSAEFPADRPAFVFSEPMKGCMIITVEEVAGRFPPRPPDAVYAETRKKVRDLAEAADRPALRALGYFQDKSDTELFKTRGAGEALLLLGDPAALEYKPVLEPHEIEMALRKAEDPKVRTYLENLRTGTPP